MHPILDMKWWCYNRTWWCSTTAPFVLGNPWNYTRYHWCCQVVSHGLRLYEFPFMEQCSNHKFLLFIMEMYLSYFFNLGKLSHELPIFFLKKEVKLKPSLTDMSLLSKLSTQTQTHESPPQPLYVWPSKHSSASGVPIWDWSLKTVVGVRTGA